MASMISHVQATERILNVCSKAHGQTEVSQCHKISSKSDPLSLFFNKDKGSFVIVEEQGQSIIILGGRFRRGRV